MGKGGASDGMKGARASAQTKGLHACGGCSRANLISLPFNLDCKQDHKAFHDNRWSRDLGHSVARRRRAPGSSVGLARAASLPFAPSLLSLGCVEEPEGQAPPRDREVPLLDLLVRLIGNWVELRDTVALEDLQPWHLKPTDRVRADRAGQPSELKAAQSEVGDISSQSRRRTHVELGTIADEAPIVTAERLVVLWVVAGKADRDGVPVLAEGARHDDPLDPS